MFGFLNVYKPKGKTSHDVVAMLRRITKIKQIGHTGTLDPFAEGVLPICIGKSTRLIEYLADDKAYIGTIQLGKSTTTYDTEGEVLKTSDKKVSIKDIEDVLDEFRGEIEQFPPIYSAIKVNGKKLYDYARAGEEVEIRSRKVTINEIRILDFDSENMVLELYIDCSKGTYIRSIANDLGEKLGVYGYLKKLVRVKAGKFLINESKNLEDIDSIDDVKKNLIYPLEYLEYPKYNLSDSERDVVSHGGSLNLNIDDGLVVLTYQEKMIAVATAENKIVKMNKVFI